MAAVARSFRDRRAAGEVLAQLVAARKPPPPVVVLGLPRGGVPVAREVARVLQAPLDVLVVRKIGMPGDRELAIGAVAVGGILVGGPGDVRRLHPELPPEPGFVHQELLELARREQAYRAGLPPLRLEGQTAVLVDDGLATGWTMLAALKAARRAGASTLVCAAPVASREAIAVVGPYADELVVARVPDRLYSIGEWYEDFAQLDDAEVLRILAEARTTRPPAGRRARGGHG